MFQHILNLNFRKIKRKTSDTVHIYQEDYGGALKKKYHLESN